MDKAYASMTVKTEKALGKMARIGAPRRSRADQLEANRQALMHAAAKVVGEEGYAKASIGKITAVAGLGQGTFYTYFGSRQDLFDILLPEVSKEIMELEEARLAALRPLSLIEIEKESFRTFANYAMANPWFARILFEAETMAPVASRAAGAMVVAQHIQRISEAWERGELPQYTPAELPALSTLLLDFRRHFIRTRLDIYPVQVPAKALIDVSMRVIVSALTPPAPPCQRTAE
jgi:AcrR family transcriptional regulator